MSKKKQTSLASIPTAEVLITTEGTTHMGHLTEWAVITDPLVRLADALIVDSEQKAGLAHELYAKLDNNIKEMQAKVKIIDDPLKDARAKLKAEFNNTTLPLMSKRDRLKTAMKIWREAEEAKADAIIKVQETIRQEQATSIAQTTGLPQAQVLSQLPPVAAQPDLGPGRGFHTTSGVVSWRRVPKWKVINASLIPWVFGDQVLYALDYAVISELRRKAGEDLTLAPSGVEFYYDQTPVNSKG